jgi:hypothetical protein
VFVSIPGPWAYNRSTAAEHWSLSLGLGLGLLLGLVLVLGALVISLCFPSCVIGGTSLTIRIVVFVIATIDIDMLDGTGERGD